jgi:adenosine kinase
VIKLAHHAMEKKKIFAFNLGAEYICQKFSDRIMQLLPYVDCIFGNEQVGYPVQSR